MRRFLVLVGLLFANSIFANSTPHDLSAGNFSQNWSDTNLITVDDNWSSVASIDGLRGDSLTGSTGPSPQTILAADDPGVIDVIANQANPNTLATGGVAEFAIADPTIALQGSGTADAPYLRIYLNTTGRQNIQVSYNLRDLDGSTDNSIQQFATHYRLGNSGVWIDIPSAYVADASSGPGLATLVTPVAAVLPAAAENQSLVQLRIMTTNAIGNDEFVGVDDISVTSAPIGSPLVVTVLIINHVSVNGGADGQATATASGGAVPYTYAWSNGATTPTINSLVAGAYTVTVTDGNGGTATASLTITEPTPVVATITAITNVSVNGGSDGQGTAIASGGVAPYTYSWSNGAATPTNVNLAAGNYTVWVTDANGGTANASMTITQPPPLSATASALTHVSVNGGSDGSAVASGSGGVGPYTYLWSNGVTTATINGLVAGTYTVTVTDANGATANASVTITEPTPVVATITASTNVSVNGGSDGSATVLATGGNPPYTYLWSTGATTATVSGLIAGSYDVTATDSTGGTDMASVTITQPTPVAATIVSFTNVSVSGGSDGSATAAASGGFAPYTFLWSSGATTATISALVAGTYTVTVTDGNGGTAGASVTITEPTPVVATITASTNVSVNGGSDGSATALATGGNPPYTYLWSTGATTATVSGLIAGSYDVTATDSTGGTDMASVTITQPTAVAATSVSSTNVSVNGGSDGSATVLATGGNPPYTYLWSNGATSITATGLSAGVYTVTATDSTGGTDDASVIINEPTAVVATIVSSTNVLVNGGSDGSATVSAAGGNPPYTYLWSTGATSAMITGLSAGTHNVTATDSTGGTDMASVTITEPTPVVATISSSTNVSINGGANGSATVVGSGGIGPYTYLWSNAATTATASGLTAGSHSVTVTDANGGTANASVTITEPPVLIVIVTAVTSESYPGAADGAASVSAAGGVSPYTYLWSTGATTATITGLSAGVYQVVVTDANGATASPTIAVTVGLLGPQAPVAVSVNAAWMLLTLFALMVVFTIRQHVVD